MFLSKTTDHLELFCVEPSKFFMIPIFEEEYANDYLFSLIEKVLTGNKPIAAISPDLRIAFIFDEQMKIAFISDSADDEQFAPNAVFQALCHKVAQVLTSVVLPNYSTLYALNISN